MPIEQKQYSTDPKWTAYLNDANGWIDVSTAFAVKLYGKITGGASIGPFTTAITTVNTFTANTTAGSAVLSNVSAFTGIVQGALASSIVGNTPTNIPINTKVLSFDSTAGTITLTNPANVTATGVSCKANVGMATYQPVSTDVATTGVFGSEAAIHWDNTGTLVTIVPNKASANETITIDSNLTGAAE